MKIRYNQKLLPLYTILTVILLFNYHFFYIIPYPFFIENLLSGNRYFVVLGCISIVVSLYYAQKRNFWLGYSNKNGIYNILVVLFFWLVEVIYSMIAYSQDMSSILGSGARLLLICLYVPFLYLFSQDGTDGFFRILNITSFIWACILILQSLVYANSRILLFDLSSYFYDTSGSDIKLLYGSIRMTLYAFGNLMIIYNFDCLYNGLKKGKEKIFCWLCFVTGIYALVVVQQTRMYLICVALCISVIILSKKGSWKSQVLKLMFVVGAVAFLMYSPYVKELIDSFSITGDNRWSTEARLYAVSYYLECIKMRPIFGNGFLSEVSYGRLIHGATGQAQYSDVGLLGLVAEIGSLAIVFYIVPVIKMIKSLLFLKRRKCNTSLDNAMLAFVLFTSISLIMTVGRYVYTLAFIIAYFAYRKRSCGEK